MAYCSECGAELLEAASFCPRCGRQRRDPSATLATEPLVVPARETVAPAGARSRASRERAGRFTRCVTRVALAVGGVALLLVALVLVLRALESRSLAEMSVSVRTRIAAANVAVSSTLDDTMRAGAKDTSVLRQTIAAQWDQLGELTLPVPSGREQARMSMIHEAMTSEAVFLTRLDDLAGATGTAGAATEDDVRSAWETASEKLADLGEGASDDQSRAVADAAHALGSRADEIRLAARLRQDRAATQREQRAALQTYAAQALPMMQRADSAMEAVRSADVSSRHISSSSDSQAASDVYKQARETLDQISEELKKISAPGSFATLQAQMLTALDGIMDAYSIAESAAYSAYCTPSPYQSQPCKTVGQTDSWARYLADARPQSEMWSGARAAWDDRYGQSIQAFYG